MRLTIYQVDAFSDTAFRGNPAAVCPLTEWLADDVLLNIAKENNLSETAFYVIRENTVEIRWFTPVNEVELCGHATLATAYVLHHCENYQQEIINFYSLKSGNLPVNVQQGKFVLNFPADLPAKITLTDELLAVTNKKPIAAYKGKTKYMLVFENQDDIETIQPNLPLISGLDAGGVIVTAKGKTHDFVSRYFAPAQGVNEDPVTGSAHTVLIPYWANQLNQTELKAFQLSQRGGELHCRLLDDSDRVEIAGKGILYLKGEIFI